jgi:hypothetical protein
MPITVTKARFERPIDQVKKPRPLGFIPNSILDFLEGHEVSGTPNEFTITGLGEIHVKLGDLRALVRALKQAHADRQNEG